MSPTTATSSATRSRASTAPPDFSWPAPHARASREGPYRFFCCAHDLFHEPTHVHVERDTEEAKVWLDSASLDYNNGFSRLELRRIQRITTDEPVSSEPGRMPTPLRRASKCSCANGGSRRRYVNRVPEGWRRVPEGWRIVSGRGSGSEHGSCTWATQVAT